MTLDRSRHWSFSALCVSPHQRPIFRCGIELAFESRQGAGSPFDFSGRGALRFTMMLLNSGWSVIHAGQKSGYEDAESHPSMEWSSVCFPGWKLCCSWVMACHGSWWAGMNQLVPSAENPTVSPTQYSSCFPRTVGDPGWLQGTHTFRSINLWQVISFYIHLSILWQIDHVVC